MVTFIFGLIFGVGILMFSLTGVSSQSKLYLDAYSLILVLGGTIAASLMSITWKNLKEVLISIKATFFKSNTNADAVTKEMLEIAEKAYLAKKLSNLSHTSENLFIQKGVRLLQSEMGPNEIKKIMAESILHERDRIKQNSEIIKTMAKYPPCFGMVGTILGLIGLLEDMSLSSGMDLIGVKMAMALVTTLYGLLLANFVLAPVSEVMVNKYHSDLKVKKMVLEAFILIAVNRHDPIMVKEYLGELGSSYERLKLSELPGEAA